MKLLNNSKVQIGEVYLMRFEGTDSEQSGVRPGLVIQNNLGNKFSPNIIAIPFTTTIKSRNLPTHVKVTPEESGLMHESTALCENPSCLSKSKIIQYIGKLSEECMQRIAVAHLLASSAIAFLDTEILLNTYQKACRLNSVTA